ncbi:MAG: hypothetical protein A07HR60_02687 [uncultured archaeon A07HR60]|nr:MAG: hypothetical protein A07HR60_02687 [uncultured archaeon A07HR60]
MSEFPAAAHRMFIFTKNRVWLNVTDNEKRNGLTGTELSDSSPRLRGAFSSALSNLPARGIFPPSR